MKVIYFAYPYSDNPKKRSEEIKKLIQKLLEVRSDIVPLVPHYIFDALYDFPDGYTHEEFGEMELELISRCDALCPVPPVTPRHAISKGVRWETAFVRWLRHHSVDVEIVEWKDLMRNKGV